MGRLRLEKPVTFLVGENGTGKSTLLEAIAAAWGFNPEGGTRNFRFSTARTHAELYRSLVLQRGPRRPRSRACERRHVYRLWIPIWLCWPVPARSSFVTVS